MTEPADGVERTEPRALLDCPPMEDETEPNVDPEIAEFAVGELVRLTLIVASESREEGADEMVDIPDATPALVVITWLPNDSDMEIAKGDVVAEDTADRVRETEPVSDPVALSTSELEGDEPTVGSEVVVIELVTEADCETLAELDPEIKPL